METQHSFVTNLMRKLPFAEMILLAILACGLLGQYLEVSQASSLITLALGGLAGAFFLSAYMPPEKKETEGAIQAGVKLGFLDLLIVAIIPKFLWISCAVCTVGFLLFQMDANNEAYKMLLIIHSLNSTVTLILVGLSSVMGAKGLGNLFPVLIRAISLFIIAAYFIWAEITGLFGG